MSGLNSNPKPSPLKGSTASLSGLWRSKPPETDVELAQVEKGFADPFDELASARVPPLSTTTPPEHTQKADADDPLGASHLGSSSSPTTSGSPWGHHHRGGTYPGLHDSQPHGHLSASSPQHQGDLWPWAAFEEDTAAAGAWPHCQGGSKSCSRALDAQHSQHHSQQRQQQQQQQGGISTGGHGTSAAGPASAHQHQHQHQHHAPHRRSLHTTSEGWVQVPEGGEGCSSDAGGNNRAAEWCSANQTMQRVHSAGDVAQGIGPERQHTREPTSQVEQGIQGPGEALLRHQSQNGSAAEDVRELFIYAIPLTKERLVFLPVAGWTENPKQEQEGIRGLVYSGAYNLRERITKYWQRMGTKDPDTFQHRMYTHGKSVLENMSAEERLMRNIPKTATKVLVYHPATVMPSTVQEQLTNMTSTYCIRSAGKAAAAGILLPVAVGIECIAVPGAGWFTLYQLYKASVGSQGGNRLKGYLNHEDNVRVCYAGDVRLNKYAERLKLCPDGILTQDDVDDLCHELNEPQLLHPLTELRNRYLKRLRHKGEGDYALLPAHDITGEEDEDEESKAPAPRPKRGWFW